MNKLWIITMLAALFAGVPARAQVHTVDPDTVIDGDVSPRAAPTPQSSGLAPPPRYSGQTSDQSPAQSQTQIPATAQPQASPALQPGETVDADTYQRDDLISAAEGVFGKGAKGLAGIIQKILKDQGEPNGYIAGREASGAFIVGLRYGSGILYHKIEGQRPVYWTGPSVGFDFGGDAAKVFVLVYNLYDTQELYSRFPEIEGHAYFVGGFSATYLRKGNVVLIPIRLGVGWRLGANIGYMKFSDHQRWLPF